MKSSINRIKKSTNFIFNSVFMVYLFICTVPVLLVVSISFNNEGDILKYGYSFFPRNLTLNAYQYIFRDGITILNSYVLTIFVTVLGTLLSVFVVAMFAYPLSKNDFKYRNFFAFVLFFTMLFNGGLVPWYIVCTQLLGLKNTIWALILPYIMNSWHVILMRTFYKTTIPDSIIDSSKIDGAGDLRTFLVIVLPLSLPGLATIGIFTSLMYWNDWWLPFLLSSKAEYYNLQFTLYKLINNIEYLTKMANELGNASVRENADLPSESARMAMCVIAMGPIVLAYPFFQKYFVKGLTVGAIKG